MNTQNGMHTLAVLGVFLVASACSNAPESTVAVSGGSQALRPLTTEEWLTDFDQMVAAFRAEYGPLQRKEQRYQFSFEQHVHDSREALAHAQTNIERESVIARFIARFEDAHVSLQDALADEEPTSFTLPLSVMPLGDGYVVYWVDAKKTSDVVRGDELLAMDGVPVAEIIERFSPFVGRPNALARRHLLARRLTDRSGIFAGDLAAGASATLQLRDARGATRELTLGWQEQPGVLAAAPQPEAPAAGSGSHTLAYGYEDAEAIRAELRSYGAYKPFFYTKEVQTQFGMKTIFPSDRAFQDFGVSLEAQVEVDYFAATYTYQGQRILLVRLDSFDTSPKAKAAERLNYLRALLSEQEPLNDALVLDVTHNPGGLLEIAEGLASMFASETFNGIVSQMHADRAQIAGYLKAASALRDIPSATQTVLDEAAQLEEAARKLDTLYTAGQALSDPMLIIDSPMRVEPDRVQWHKPRIVLIDELSTSAADMLPLLVKANKLAPIFGSRSAGAGGNVEIATVLTNSARNLYLTRGTAAVFDATGRYPAENFVEDDGVTPDIEYDHTLQDFRAGYVGYVEAFSKALLDSAKP